MGGGVRGGDGVRRVVCRYRYECFGRFIEEGNFLGGRILFHSYSFTMRRFMGVLEKHCCESALFGFIFGLEAMSGV